MLVQLTYASRAAVDVTPQVVRDIVEKSRKNNGPMGITGALCYTNGLFLQKLEGDRQRVNQIYRKIQNDVRHTDTVILDYLELDGREFTRWSMGMLTHTDDNRELFIKYSDTNEFNPYSMSARALRAFFTEVRDSIYWLK